MGCGTCVSIESISCKNYSSLSWKVQHTIIVLHLFSVLLAFYANVPRWAATNTLPSARLILITFCCELDSRILVNN